MINDVITSSRAAQSASATVFLFMGIYILIHYDRDGDKIERSYLLILDNELGMHPMDNGGRMILLEIIEDRPRHTF